MHRSVSHGYFVGKQGKVPLSLGLLGGQSGGPPARSKWEITSWELLSVTGRAPVTGTPPAPRYCSPLHGLLWGLFAEGTLRGLAGPGCSRVVFAAGAPCTEPPRVTCVRAD